MALSSLSTPAWGECSPKLGRTAGGWRRLPQLSWAENQTTGQASGEAPMPLSGPGDQASYSAG